MPNGPTWRIFFSKDSGMVVAAPGDCWHPAAANPPTPPGRPLTRKLFSCLERRTKRWSEWALGAKLVINGVMFLRPLEMAESKWVTGVVSPFFKRIIFTPVITGKGFSPTLWDVSSRERSRIALEGKSRQVPCLGWFNKGMPKLFRVEFDLSFINLDATLKPPRNPVDFSLWRSSEMLQPAVVFYIYIPTFDTTWSPRFSSFLFFGNEHKVPTYIWLYNIRSSALHVLTTGIYIRFTYSRILKFDHHGFAMFVKKIAPIFHNKKHPKKRFEIQSFLLESTCEQFKTLSCSLVVDDSHPIVFWNGKCSWAVHHWVILKSTNKFNLWISIQNAANRSDCDVLLDQKIFNDTVDGSEIPNNHLRRTKPCK